MNSIKNDYSGQQSNAKTNISPGEAKLPKATELIISRQLSPAEAKSRLSENDFPLEPR